jgi:hypothetical protein
MTPRAHRAKWTLCIADEAKSRRSLSFEVGSMKHFAGQRAAEAERDALIRAGKRCYVMPPYGPQSDR